MPGRSQSAARARLISKWPSEQGVEEFRERVDVPAFRLRPRQVTWEMMRACEWMTSARSATRSVRDKQEFSTAEAFHLIGEVAAMRVPLLALTGGDPLLRPDLFPLVEFAARRSVRTSLTLFPTPLLDAHAVADLKGCGLMRVGFWLHGPTASRHDRHTGRSGSHRRTQEAIGLCNEAGLAVQINTIIARWNFHDIDPMIELLTRLDAVLWNVFCFVPANLAEKEQMLSPEQHEEVFARLYDASKRVHFQIKTTEGQHYQRYLLERQARESRGGLSAADVMTLAPKGVNDGQGFVFINHHGDVYPSRFLPLSAGNLTTESLAEVYSESPLFVSLRDSSKLKGKCGRCAFRKICGGSRARAYAVTGDLFAEEPCCAYQP
jgi:radical SAM protein with 4Fe4S-binding SPASM domain